MYRSWSLGSFLHLADLEVHACMHAWMDGCMYLCMYLCTYVETHLPPSVINEETAQADQVGRPSAVKAKQSLAAAARLSEVG